ncbi:glutamate--tRNA ligase [Sphingomonas sp. CFBP 13720]|uniref:glutamate--tRNA ligase n=1 Tax=Sphingomonas sp. CFBP 13720 TaxID=2775302 RepID=UPI001782942D|nr:glutamate--tRNA ligase [Sphingomonas sp. CFBP 13720]MBD8679809.1 glutamate--tRNA ligase [Sphingomonas sp. CFBP 13720]
MTVTRFAPSPTGHLHIGNLRTALHNWMYAKRHGGRFLLRIDDTDPARSEERFVDAIRTDLAWLGLVPDGEERQSARFDRYEAVFAELVAAGRIYPAYETPEELDLRRKVLAGRGLPPVYDRAALALTDADRARMEGEGRTPHWRFRLDHAPIEWDDMVRGAQRFDGALLSDPVVRRADGSWLYLLPSVIDDADMAVTHVVRGEDHVSNTATQMQMFAAMGATPPTFAHEALLVGSEGKLSKRLGSLGIDHFRGAGIEPEAVVALLARLGTSDPVEPVTDRQTLIDTFDFARFGRAPARFDEAELAQLNTRIVHQLPFERVAATLPADMDAAAWDAVRGNLDRVGDAADWWRVVTGPVEPAAFDAEDRAFLTTAARVARSIDWDAPWAALTGALKAETGRKGKALFLPLRLALTGRAHGPDMAALLPLIGRERALTRLE